MNRTNWEHVAVALAHQIVVGLLTGNWWAGAALGSGIFIGREFAQAERRVLFAHGWNTLKEAHAQGKYPELMAHNFKRYWDLDSLLDMVMPIVATVVVALVLTT